MGILDVTEHRVHLKHLVPHGLDAASDISGLAVDPCCHQQAVDTDATLLQFVDGFLIGAVEGEAGDLHQTVVLVVDGRVALL